MAIEAQYQMEILGEVPTETDLNYVGLYATLDDTNAPVLRFIDEDGTVYDIGAESGVEYKGAYNAFTNTPTIADGVGENGDYYRVAVSGSQDFGSGVIQMLVGDLIIYNKSLLIWQRVAGNQAVGDVVGPASSLDLEIAVFDGTTGKAVKGSGIRNYGSSASDPVSPSPNDGDTYYNTAISKQMVYDSTRTKWLSVESAQIAFGRQGNTGAGAYYRGIDRRPFTAARGRVAEFNGTIVAITYARNDSDAATFEVTASGTQLATVASSANSGKDKTLNANFSEDDILGVRNEAGGNTTSGVMGWVTIRWRA